MTIDSKDLRVGLVVSDDLDYGLDLANALGDSFNALSLYLSKPLLFDYLGVPRGEATSEQLIELLHQKHLIPEHTQIYLFQFPRMRDPRSFKVVNQLRMELENGNLDVVHILMGPGELWISFLSALIRKLPVVSTMIIPQPNVGERMPKIVSWMIAKVLTIGSDLIIVNGADQVEVVKRLYSVPSRKVLYVALIPRISAAKWADNERLEEPQTILFPGKAQRRKGLEYFIKAQPFVTEILPSARFLIAAHGEELSRCREFIADESKFEIQDGFLSSSELAEYFQRASLVALPYLSASTSAMLTTAYVFGKPVVVTNVGALPEYVVEGETGFLVPPEDPKGLANAIIAILGDGSKCQRMGKNANSWVQNELKKIVQETRNAYLQAYKEFHHLGAIN